MLKLTTNPAAGMEEGIKKVIETFNLLFRWTSVWVYKVTFSQEVNDAEQVCIPGVKLQGKTCVTKHVFQQIYSY